MFSTFDFDVIRRSLGYLFVEGMTFTLTLTALSAFGGLVLGTLIALNLNLAIFHRAAGATGFLHRLGQLLLFRQTDAGICE